METRTFDNLIVDGEDLIIAGDIEIYGILTINNANLIVSGAIQFDSKKSNTFVTEENSIHITNGSISAESIFVGEDYDLNVFVKDGDIYVADILCAKSITLSGGGDITCHTLDAENVTSDGNIIVDNTTDAENPCIINCFNYFVSGDNDSGSIVATQDIYILGDSDSCDLRARDIFIAGDAYLNSGGITAFGSVYIGGEINECTLIDVGR